MAITTRTQRRYDHRLREHVRNTRDIDCAIQQGVPRSTARGWLRDPGVQVVSVEALSMDATQLQREVLRLRSRIQKLIALLRVLLVVLPSALPTVYGLKWRELAQKNPECRDTQLGIFLVFIHSTPCFVNVGLNEVHVHKT